MTIDYNKLKSWPFKDVVETYTERDTMLYALSIGLGRDPLDMSALPFVYEGKGAPIVVPTMPVVLGFPGFWMQDPASGIDWKKIVLGEFGLVLHKPLPPAGTVLGNTRVTRIVDKGTGKGAVVTVERTISDAATRDLYATIRQVSFCRGDGGFSDSGQPSDTSGDSLQASPDTPPDIVYDQPTRPEAALLFRLHADRNPLHADPAAAAEANFRQPILHGLATFSVAAVAIVRTVCGHDPARLKSIETRFSAPVYPGETIRTELWQNGSTIMFRARVLERDIVVLSNGCARTG